MPRRQAVEALPDRDGVEAFRVLAADRVSVAGAPDDLVRLLVRNVLLQNCSDGFVLCLERH